MGSAQQQPAGRTADRGHQARGIFAAPGADVVAAVTDGVLRFALARAAQLIDLVVTAAVHPDSGAATGQAVAVPEIR